MLKIGDIAPQFNEKDQDGKVVTLEEFKGRKIILYFYPRDNTPGCTAQACSLRDGKSELADMGFTIIGVSPNNAKSHLGFIQKKSLNFSLLTDEENVMSTAYGVWGLKKFMGKEFFGIKRTTFIIDENGVIERIFDKVKTKSHFEQILESYKN